MNFEAFSIKGAQSGRLKSETESLQIKRERDAKLLSEAIGKRALARRNWDATLNKLWCPPTFSRKELAKMHDEYSEASRRREKAFKEVWRLTDMIEKRALETGQV